MPILQQVVCLHKKEKQLLFAIESQANNIALLHSPIHKVSLMHLPFPYVDRHTSNEITTNHSNFEEFQSLKDPFMTSKFQLN